jgi:hypothetical protein
MTERYLDSWLKAMTPPPFRLPLDIVGNENEKENQKKTQEAQGNTRERKKYIQGEPLEET